MRAARRRRVGIGDRILAGGAPGVVISVAGTRVRVADEAGGVRTVTAAELAGDPWFEIAAPASPRGSRPEVGLEGLPAAVVEDASWWEAHIAEVVYGLRPDVPARRAPSIQWLTWATSVDSAVAAWGSSNWVIGDTSRACSARGRRRGCPVSQPEANRRDASFASR